MSQGTHLSTVDRALHSYNCLLQVLKGSHLCGRIDHLRVGGQAGADMERVEHLKKVSQLMFAHS